jgi:hypothetical protein
MGARDPADLYVSLVLATVVLETMTLASFRTVWTTLAAKYPQLRGAFCWQSAADAAESWSASTVLGPLIAGELGVDNCRVIHGEGAVARDRQAERHPGRACRKRRVV